MAAETAKHSASDKQTVLVLDPGSSTGYALASITFKENDKGRSFAQKADVYEYGFIDVDLSSEYQGDHCIDLMDSVQTMIADHNVSAIAVEDYFFNNKFRSGCNVNGAFRTAIHILARQNELPYSILGISAWKTYITGRSTPTKPQKIKWGAALAKKLHVQQALWEHFGIRFPNHSLSPKTGKPVAFRNDIIDAVAQAIYYCCAVRGTPAINVTCSVSVPEDHPFKTERKKMFVYDA
jgi:Holliday junction resolvasome RuvABC endonuclease subunit